MDVLSVSQLSAAAVCSSSCMQLLRVCQLWSCCETSIDHLLYRYELTIKRFRWLSMSILPQMLYSRVSGKSFKEQFPAETQASVSTKKP